METNVSQVTQWDKSKGPSEITRSFDVTGDHFEYRMDILDGYCEGGRRGRRQWWLTFILVASCCSCFLVTECYELMLHYCLYRWLTKFWSIIGAILLSYIVWGRYSQYRRPQYYRPSFSLSWPGPADSVDLPRSAGACKRTQLCFAQLQPTRPHTGFV